MKKKRKQFYISDLLLHLQVRARLGHAQLTAHTTSEQSIIAHFRFPQGQRANARLLHVAEKCPRRTVQQHAILEPLDAERVAALDATLEVVAAALEDHGGLELPREVGGRAGLEGRQLPVDLGGAPLLRRRVMPFK